jgi:hypothetical protein
MKLFNSRSEKIGVGIIVILAIILAFKGQYEIRQLKRKGVYVIGKLHSSSFGSESGWMFKYKYEFNNKSYFRDFSGPLENENKEDSLMFFHILPDAPNVCRQVLTPHVPNCLTIEMTPAKGWSEIPVKTCD